MPRHSIANDLELVLPDRFVRIRAAPSQAAQKSGSINDVILGTIEGSVPGICWLFT